jgi:hypothetical protein
LYNGIIGYRRGAIGNRMWKTKAEKAGKEFTNSEK